MKKFIFTALVLLVFSSTAWGQASLTVEVYPEKFVKIGEDFWYNIQIWNTGDDIAYNVEVTPTYDTNITTAAATVPVGNLAAASFWNMNIQVTVDGSTAQHTQMTSSFDVDYEDDGGTPYSTVTVEAKNRAYNQVVKQVTNPPTDTYVDQFDFNSDGSKIVYSLWIESWNSNLWIVNSDGTGNTQLTTSTDCESNPKFSSDDTQVIYQTNVNRGTVPDATYDATDEYNADIYVMDLATKAATQLTSDGDCQKKPQVSPDGAYILFRDDHRVKAEDDTYSRLWIMDADGSNQLEISGDYGGNWASWTPDSQWIIYSESGNNANPTGYAEMWKVRPDGTDATQLTFTYDDCEQMPKVSPDGQWILFKKWWGTKLKAGHNDLVIMDIDGGNIQTLQGEDPDMSTDVHQGEWSPDGRWILFGWETMSNDPGEYLQASWIVDRRNRYRANLCCGYYDMQRQWSPDGTFFGFIDDNNVYNRTTDKEDLWIYLLDTEDGDEDLLANWEEDVVGSDPAEFDTDGDSAGDGREFDQGSNPLVADCPGVCVLTATAGDALVELSWEAPAKSGAIASYTLFRSETAGGPYEELEAGIDGTTFTDTTVTNGTTYYYVVVAMDADDYMGGDSNEAEATPQAETDDDTDDDTGDDDTADDDTAPSAGDDDDDDDDGCCGC